MDISLTKNDAKEIIKRYPELSCSLPRNVVWGTLNFACSYDNKTEEIVYNNEFESFIEDCYEIRIDFNQKDDFGFPKTFEESDFIKKYAEDKKIYLRDLHLNVSDNYSCCLGIFPEYVWQGVCSFITDKIIPFFYWQSYYRIYGKEPWAGFSHGNKGISEAMMLPLKEYSKGYNQNVVCPCGSGRKYKKCCYARDNYLEFVYYKNITLEIVRQYPDYKIEQIAYKLGKTSKTVESYLVALKKDEYIN